ncbi:hypothetical protein O9993_09375 [Vibrio lentus]|nr:hypothetical protein [Vibrio lentus]
MSLSLFAINQRNRGQSSTSMAVLYSANTSRRKEAKKQEQSLGRRVYKHS